MVKPYYSNLRVITVNFSGARICLDFYGIFFFFLFCFCLEMTFIKFELMDFLTTQNNFNCHVTHKKPKLTYLHFLLLMIPLILIFLSGFYGLSRLFHTFWPSSIIRWDENGRSPRKTT